jgi:recombinational DNA repair ATPase RecF
MLIESVTAVAFGPFKGATLDFSPQLTVVYGPNEAGKSSWHAAIYASLCGMRRARGQLAQDRDFAKLRRPWSGSAWEVRAIVRLDNGRRVELRQNLSELAHCSAVDADFGRDVAAEILNEGTPDAARWLGLDRQSFLAVACVRQAEIRGIAESAESLQGELQRAAASAARDSTAAEAIARLEDFQREQVGQDFRHSTKPLRRANIRAEETGAALTSAREKHAEWLAFETQARQLAEKADEYERKLRILRALCARKQAGVWRSRLDRARALASAYPSGQPALASDESALADDVASALSLWSSKPEFRLLTGPSAADIRAEIAKLPPMPSGDRIPRAEVIAAMTAYERATQALEFHQTNRLPATPVPDAKGLTANRLRELARALETAVPLVDSGLETDHREAQRRLEGVRSSRLKRSLIVGLAVAGVLGGVGVWASWNHWIGAALVLFGIIAFVWFVVRSGEKDREQALGAFLKIEAQLLSQSRAMEVARETVNAARSQIVEAGLPLNSTALRELADGLVLAERNRQLQEDWSRRCEKLQFDLAGASDALTQALRHAGVAELVDLTAAFHEYEQTCHARAQQADRAAACDSLNQQLLDREAAEKAAVDVQTQCSNAAQKIMATLAACGLEAPDPEAASDVLRRWQDERKARLVKFDEASRGYAELNALLDGGTLEDLEARTSEHQRRAEELAAASGPLPEAAVDVDLDEEIRGTEKLAHDAELAARSAEDRARDRAQYVPSVSEAEEALDSARQELERVTRLNRTLTLTLDFLGKAEERVHRDIAPLLAAGLRQWLSSATEGRYTDARVDPRDLSVQVLGPDSEWRDAHRLSHGTAEQIYLLLRVALAERLATTGETCPLILDDVLVQSGRARKHALLDAIVSISRGRQVILFTLEEEVLRWAQANVVAPDRLVGLPGP